MSIYDLKPLFQDKLRPISNGLVSHGVTANQVTFSAILLSVVTAYIIKQQQRSLTILSNPNPAIWWLLPTAMFMRMALNAIDGMIAREHNQASILGAILNEVGDVVSDSLLTTSLMPQLKDDGGRYSCSERTHLTLINRLSTLTEVIAIASSLSTGQRANHGPLGKSDRAVMLGIIGAIMALDLPNRINHKLHSNADHQQNKQYIRHLLWLNELLLIKTCINRMNFIIKYCIHQKFEQWHPTPISILTELTVQPIVITSTINSVNTLLAIESYTSQEHIIMSTQPNNDDGQAKTLKPSDGVHKNIAGNEYAHVANNKPSAIIAHQGCFNAYDGTAIYYRYWLTMPLADVAQQSTKQQNTQKQVILLHRGHEHSGRLSELGERFAQAGYEVFAWDARGNGRSGGIKDHADSVTELERDLNDFVTLVTAQTGIAIEDTIIVASSIGAVLAAAWVHDYAPKLRGMILGTPALSIRLYIPFAIPALKFARRFGLMTRVSSYVKAQVLTHDKAAQDAYNADPLISGSISSDLLIDTHATGQRLLDDASAITTPTFILCAGKDYVVDKQSERQFYDQLSSTTKRWQLYPDSFHAIFHETNKADIFSDCIDFADSLFGQPIDTVDLIAANHNSASKDKVDRLAIKPFNPSFAVTRFAMQKFGHVSDAIATGLEHGFDSGSSLDKVYANNPRGSNAFGKAVDKFYLNNIGWQGIRIRREHLLELGRLAISARMQAQNSAEQLDKQSAKQIVRVLDIASGNGYYMFDLLAEYENLNAELRDYDSHNVQVLADKASSLAISERVNVVKRDAFDFNSYSDSANSNFDMAIASGVFELFSDNSLVTTALNGIADSLAIGGYLLYTNQPWHPEQEFISKTLNNHRGSSWVMRCRSQAEMDQLVTQAGFKKLDMRIDRFGIFTVSLAIKIA